MKTDEMKKQTLSVAQWHEMAQRGVDIPMSVPINGISMMPLIRKNRDIVAIRPLKRMPLRGDVVLFHDAGRERYVLHRAWQVTERGVLTWGDNCLRPDGILRFEDVWGIAQTVRRGKKTIVLDSDPARRCGLWIGRLRHVYCRVRSFAYAAAMRIVPRPVRKLIKKVLRWK